ncbi:MAG: MATE family efflux transporter, partial [Oscillospiraceae bacterium]
FGGFIFAAVNIVGTGFLSATERSREAFVCALLRGCAAIVGFVCLLSALFGMDGVWLSFPSAELLTGVLTVIFVARWGREKRFSKA